MNIVEITDFEKDQILFLAKKLSWISGDSSEDFCKKSRELAEYLFSRIKSILDNFSQLPDHYLIFRRFPTEFCENTPENNNLQIGEKTVLARIQSILLSYLGEMISYEAEGGVPLFQDIVPVKNMAELQTSVGSNKELEIHTEQAFSDLRPDILCLACLKMDSNAFTYILPVNILLAHLSTPEINLLYQPLWYIGIDLSFQINGTDAEKRGPISILYGPRENPSLVFDQDLMEGTTEESQKILLKIVNIYYQYRISHCLQPGDILFIDNRYGVHGRSPFFPKYDGNDRFLIRSFAVFDFAKSEYARKGRMVLAKYS